MAFIRDYAAMSAGDPFSLRIPKKLRKLKIGRAIGKFAKGVLPIATSFIPGLGGMISSRISAIANKYGVDEDQLRGFARQYGFDEGDPPRSQKRRKQAAAGPKAKAASKRQARGRHHAAPTSARPSFGAAAASNLRGAAASTLALGKKFAGGDMSGALAEILHGGKGGGGGLMGGHRRSMNFTNVKALRRGLRRVEGFEKLVKRVEKAYPRMRRQHAHPHHFGKKRRRAA